MRISGRFVAAGAVGIVVIAFGGGALSGKLEHIRGAATSPARTTPATRPAKTIPATPTSAPNPVKKPTTLATAPAATTVAQVRADLVNDMSLDLSSQRLDPNPTTRAAIARSPAAVAERHSDIGLAWAPDKVAPTEAAYDASVAATAANPAAPSFTAAAFVVSSWGPVTIKGAVASATFVGHYVLAEPAVPRGTVTRADQKWALTLSLVSGRWRLESRTTSPV